MSVVPGLRTLPYCFTHTRFIKIIGAVLVNKIRKVTSIQFNNTACVYCIACSSPKVKFSFVTVYSYIHTYINRTPVPGSWTRNPNPEIESASQRERSYIFKSHRGYSCSLLMNWCSKLLFCIHLAVPCYQKALSPMWDWKSWYTDFPLRR